MPELPEVEALSRFLDANLAGWKLARAELSAFPALKTVLPPLDELVGRTVSEVGRRGKFVLIGTSDGPWLIAHLARGGWIRWRDQLPRERAKLGRGPLALRLGRDDGAGFDMTEAGTEKRLALWVVREPEDVAPLAGLGPDPMADGFDLETLRGSLVGERGQLKKVLTDQRVLAGIGNAYSDEILHAAHLSPFKPTERLKEDELARLHEAMVSVLGSALDRSMDLPASGLKAEKRAGMAVHGRAGQPCPVCGDTVREVSFATTFLDYCPTCQTGGKVLADRRLSRLLR